MSVPASPTSAGRRILIIDDNPINRDILCETVKRWGFDVLAVEGGEIALRFLAHAHKMGAAVDLVILDYNMPGMNGAEVLRALRSDAVLHATPVVLLTSVDHRIAIRDLKEAGAGAILTKPARSELLLATICEQFGEVVSPEISAAVSSSVPVTQMVATHQTLIPQPAPAAPDVFQQPAATPQPIPAPPATPAAAAHYDEPARLDILVAEDNEVNQIVFQQILGDLGYSFEIMPDGRRAVEAWQRLSPRVILMDVSMPDMNGFDATEKIREIEAANSFTRTPIVGVTAHALKGDRERCLDAGMDDYFTKPVSPDRLATKLREWMTAPLAASA